MTTPKPTPPLPLGDRLLDLSDKLLDAGFLVEAREAVDIARAVRALFPKGGSGEAGITADQVRLLLPRLVEWHDEEWTDTGAFHLEGGSGKAPNLDTAKALAALLDLVADFDPVSEDWHPKPALAAHPAPKDRGSERVKYSSDDMRGWIIDTLEAHKVERRIQNGLAKHLVKSFEKTLEVTDAFPKDRGEGWRVAVHKGRADAEAITQTLFAASSSPRDKAGEGQ